MVTSNVIDQLPFTERPSRVVSGRHHTKRASPTDGIADEHLGMRLGGTRLSRRARCSGADCWGPGRLPTRSHASTSRMA